MQVTSEPHDQIPIDPEPELYCDECGDGIPEGTAYYQVDGLRYCLYCMGLHKEMA